LNILKRTISKSLIDWKNDARRKVLLVRGARQVGKTYSIREMGNEFPFFLEINFEDDKEIHSLFEGNMDVQKIIQTISVQYNIPVNSGETLIFFDEIQACPNAIRSLRYFYEKIPDLHVVAAGSLLEFTLKEIPSFGVGRIQTLFMYPVTFHEFLESMHPALAESINNASPTSPLDHSLHQLSTDYFKTYQIIGGMPEILAEFITSKNYLKCMQLLDNLIVSFQADFSKYKQRSPVQGLRNVFQSIAIQSGRKFIYNHVAPEMAINSIKLSLELLIRAGLAYKIPHSSASGIPLGGQLNPRKFKILPFDSGIYQRVLGLNLKDYFLYDDIQLINKGNIAEITVGLQLLHNQSPLIQPQLYYWHREAKSSNAEIDYLIQQGSSIVPVEVKAGTKGQMQSMFIFLKEKNLPKGIRVSMENFSQLNKIQNIPLYAIKSLVNPD